MHFWKCSGALDIPKAIPAKWGDECSEDPGLWGQEYLPKPAVGVELGKDLGCQLCQRFHRPLAGDGPLGERTR